MKSMNILRVSFEMMDWDMHTHSPHLDKFGYLSWLGFLCGSTRWTSLAKWIWKLCNSKHSNRNSISYIIFKLNDSKPYYDHIAPFSTLLDHVAPFALDKVLLEYLIMALSKSYKFKNVCPNKIKRNVGVVTPTCNVCSLTSSHACTEMVGGGDLLPTCGTWTNS